MRPVSLLSSGVLLGLSLFATPVFAAKTKAAKPAPPAPPAANANTPKEPELSDATIGAVGKIKELADSGKLDDALEACIASLPSAPAKTMDRALLCQIKAQLYLQKGEEQKAVAPLEEALEQGVLEDKVAQDFRLYLCQLHFAGQRLPQALAWLDTWRSLAPAGTVKPEQVLLRGAILFQMNRHPEALEAAREAIRLEPKPKDQSWMLLLASLQQAKDDKGCAEYLELVLREAPGDESLWRQLCQIYLATDQPLRALLTLERGMDRKFFKDPADLETLVTLHYNLEHYTAAADLIEQGLKDGRLPPAARHFELLSFCWQLHGDNVKALAVLDRAATQLKSGDFQISAAQILFKDGRRAEALARLRVAVGYPDLKNPPKAWIFLTYLALELHDLNTAAEGVQKLGEFPAASKEAKDFGRALEALKRSNASDSPKVTLNPPRLTSGGSGMVYLNTRPAANTPCGSTTARIFPLQINTPESLLLTTPTPTNIL